MSQIKTETKVGLFVIGALAIFCYISFHLGLFRLDRTKYRQYVLYFDDISGLDKKADVKIAGVKVGWVEQVEISEDAYQAQACIMVDKKYKLYHNAQAKVRQENLLGSKYIELNPGTSDLPALKQGDVLAHTGRSSVPLDDVLFQAQDVIRNLQMITASLKEQFAADEGRVQIAQIMRNIQDATQQFASFSAQLDRSLSHNEEHINTIMQNLTEFSREMRETLPGIRSDIARVAQVFGTDVAQAAGSITALSASLERASGNAQTSLQQICSISEKINNGHGTIGKLINEEETYHDIRIAAQGLKNYFAKVNALSIVFDSHGEYMFRPAEHYIFFGKEFQDAKGYLNMRIHPNDDYFYIAQLVSAQKGTTHRRKINREWRDEQNNLLNPSELLKERIAIPELIGDIDEVVRVYDTFKLGLQVGKIYRDFVFRCGLFENTVGVGVDFDIPFDTDDLRWVTSLEIFDFRGRDRINDPRPHFKWINRVFLLRNIYFTFGADDFISKKNANGFFGGGIRFCDEDIKYLAGKLSMSNFTS